MALWSPLLRRAPSHPRILPSLLRSLSISIRWHCYARTESLTAISKAGDKLSHERLFDTTSAETAAADIKISGKRKQSRVIQTNAVPSLASKVEVVVKGVSKLRDETKSEVSPTLILQKTNFLIAEGFTQEQVEKVSETLAFVKVSFVNLVSVIEFLKTAKVWGKDAGAVLIKCPNLLSRSAESLEKKTKILESIGLQRQRLITWVPRLFSLSTENIRNKVTRLLSLGLDTKVFQRFPLVLTLSTEERLYSKLAFLRRIGIKDEDIAKLVSSQPQLLGVKLETLRRRCNTLKEQGLSDEEVTYIVTKQPSVLCQKEELLQKKINYLVNSLNRNVKELVSFPAFLSYNLEHRTIPRFNSLAERKKEGLFLDHVHLATVLSVSEETFAKWLQKKEKKQKPPMLTRIV